MQYRYLVSTILMLSSFLLAQETPAAAGTPNADLVKKIHTLEDLQSKIADHGAGLYILAIYYIRAGDLPKALDTLKRSVALDEGFDPAEDAEFAALHNNVEFESLLETARRHYPAMENARLAYIISEKDLIPEGLAAIPGDRGFYLGSLYHKKIVKISKDGTVSDFTVATQPEWADVCGIKVDSANFEVWAATCPDVGTSELLHFGPNGKLIDRHSPTGPGPHELNDLVLRGEKEAYVTDTLGHQVLRFDRGSNTFTPLSFSRPLRQPNGIAISDDGSQLYVADEFGVFQVNLPPGAGKEIQPEPRSTLAGIDGLYWYRGNLVAVQNIGMRRIILARLSAGSQPTAKVEVLENRSNLITSPTTGAIAGTNFYFISNSQIENLRDEKILDPSKLAPVMISVLPLKE